MVEQDMEMIAPDSIPLKAYVEAAREIAVAHFNPRSQLRVLIVTEDANVIRELTQNYPDIKWLYTTGHRRQHDDSKIADRISSGLTSGHTEMMVARMQVR